MSGGSADIPARPLIVDSSVAVKWFKIEESGVDEARELLRQHREELRLLTAPTLLRLEVLNALRYTDLDDTRLVEAAGAFEGFHLRLVEVDGDLTAEALRLAVRHGLTLYDAVFAALALRHDTELITADRRLADSGACRVRLLG